MLITAGNSSIWRFAFVMRRTGGLQQLQRNTSDSDLGKDSDAFEVLNLERLIAVDETKVS